MKSIFLSTFFLVGFVLAFGTPKLTAAEPPGSNSLDATAEHEITVEEVKKILVRQQLQCQPGPLGRVSLLAFEEVREAVGIGEETYQTLAEQVKL